MTDYTQITSFAPKDALNTGDPLKKIVGSQFDAEFQAIATAVASKLDSSSNVAETAITDGSILARVASTETISAVWTFTAIPVFNGGTSGASAPFTVDSTYVVTNLNADLLDGQQGSYYLDAGNLTGTLANARVAASNVTQHQASLSIAGSQLTGSIADARLSSNVSLYNASPANFTGTLQYGGVEVGFRGVPQNAQTGNYTCVAGDAGKHIFHASGDGAGDTYTIPANASVAYAVGTVLTFINRSADTISIAITSDTMYLAGTTTTGTRTLAQNGVATAVKVESTVWIISGSGLT